jgi:hypothetical protein
VLVTAVAGAQTDRTQYFVDLLSSSTSFSVRAQAALALGRVPQSAQVRSALTAALRDNEPAVRAAAASAMERQADAQLLAPLRAAVASERDSTVLDAERRAITALEAVATAAARRHPGHHHHRGCRLLVHRGRSRAAFDQCPPAHPATTWASALRATTRPR